MDAKPTRPSPTFVNLHPLLCSPFGFFLLDGGSCLSASVLWIQSISPRHFLLNLVHGALVHSKDNSTGAIWLTYQQTSVNLFFDLRLWTLDFVGGCSIPIFVCSASPTDVTVVFLS